MVMLGFQSLNVKSKYRDNCTYTMKKGEGWEREVLIVTALNAQMVENGFTMY